MTQMFEQDIGEYDYEREYNLNSMPNRIDFLIIKKNTDIVPENGIGKIFRKYNIFEYKSPGQALGIDEYHLAIAYAHLYTYYEKDVHYEDVTVSFVREGKPVKLMEYLGSRLFEIEKTEPGIYRVTKQDHIDMQIIVTKELREQYIWLKALTDKLTRDEAVRLAKEAVKESDPQGKVRIQSILDLVSILNKNKSWMKEEVGTMGAFRDMFQDEFDKKDQQIHDLSKQLQSKDEQLQSKDEQLQTEQEENSKLRKEIAELKKQLNKIAVL